MKKWLFLIFLVISFSNCKSSKRSKQKRNKSAKVITKKSKVKNGATAEFPRTSENKSTTVSASKPQNIINFSKEFLGVRYKWGGTTKRGMDCSGLIHESFKAHQVYLPRISRDMAKKGKKIKLRETLKGDLLFFKTGKNRRNAINHVGLVVEIKNDAIYFIHATTSNGVIISSLNEKYWLSAFTEARRVL
ncbi:C40 family peptidase [Algibacter sp. 2305UL17-15]|uniref:C40 family peptidase n=1 Tax=Algibacter sp. 2305UL17-15 TaxID=3231268 RepID=UPI00345925BE